MPVQWMSDESGRPLRRGLAGALALCVVTALLLPVGWACQKQVADHDSQAARPIVDSVLAADGSMIYYVAAGTGDSALVFVHCWSCDRGYWDGQVDALASDYRVVAIDLAGHGQSRAARDSWLMSDYAGDVEAVIRKLDLQPVVLVGHSMGGAVVIEVARRMPDRVTAVIGVDVYQDLSYQMSEEEVEGFLAGLVQDYEGATKAFVRSLFLPDADSALVARVAADMAAAPPAIAVPSLRHVLRYDAATVLQEMRKPVRGIHSDAYPTNVEANQATAESFAVRYMPGRGHFLQLEDPVTFNRLLRETIDEFWPARAGSEAAGRE
ncbi:MAG: alpha/beta hydrolase [candidate division Zixibacteria bacterium]|jgi:pimeloyl-ACP methyl ester carboxylesterase|nr:alpha/beta hydrolase [candidate division Zixibacteria bacterium]